MFVEVNMVNLTYHDITAAAAHTVRVLSRESANRLCADNQSCWDMARGVVRCWEEAVGAYAAPEDRRLLNCLVDEMACRADAGLSQ